MFLFIFRNIFILKSSLYDCNIAVSPFSFLLFVYLFFTHPFIFIRSVSLYLKSVSCSQHIVLSLCFSLILIGLNITIIGSHWFSIFLLFLFFCSQTDKKFLVFHFFILCFFCLNFFVGFSIQHVSGNHPPILPAVVDIHFTSTYTEDLQYRVIFFLPIIKYCLKKLINEENVFHIHCMYIPFLGLLIHVVLSFHLVSVLFSLKKFLHFSCNRSTNDDYFWLCLS